MTTTLDPTGTPETFFNRSGVTIEEITLAQNDNIQIVAQSGATVVILSAFGTTAPTSVILPVASEVGDYVEIYVIDNVTVAVEAASGDTINGYSNSQVGPAARKFLKFGATEWVQS